MVDQRGRDNPPIFYLPSQLGNHKYHALLTEPIATGTTVLMDLAKEDQLYQREGEVSIVRPRGLYGFHQIEERDKFCRRCNGLSELEHLVCIPVTVPNLVAGPLETTIRYQSGNPAKPKPTTVVTDPPKGNSDD